MEERVAPAFGAGAGLIGLTSAAVWILHLPLLLRLAPGYSATQLNSSVGLMAAGLGLAFLERRVRVAAACGIFCGTLGAATLAEYWLKLKLGIDIVVSHAGMAAEIPGRMSVNSAACFLLAGTVLACAALSPRIFGKITLFGGYGLLVIAASALTGYGLNIEIAYRWASQTRMSMLTAVAFLLLGAGLFKIGWRQVAANRTMWLTLLVAGIVAGTSILTWVAVNTEYRRMGEPQAVPDLLLFTGLTRACVAAIVIFLWRNSRDRLDRAEVLNTDLQDKFAERTAQLKAIFEAVRVATWSVDLISDRREFQGQIGPIFGFSSGEADFRFDDLVRAVHPEDLRKLREASSRSQETGKPIDQEFRVIWPDGSVHWVLTQGGVSKYAGEKPVAMGGINLDITRLKNAEMALQESEASVRTLNQALERRIRIQTKELMESEKRFRLMVEGLRDYAFFMLDTQGNVVSWNLGAQRIHGYTGEEIIGKHFSILLTPEDREGSNPQDQLQRAAEHGQHTESGWRLRRDGARFWAHVLITAVYDEAGDLCGFSEVTRDITERKRAQEEIEEQRKRAEQSNQAKSQFLASMSHEIRTPMNAILGMTDLLWETELDEDQRHYVEIFRRAGANLMDLINDILDLSKIESGRLELEKREFDVETVVADVVELLAGRAHDKGIGLRTRLLPGLTKKVVGDAARLRQVLVNLVGNAIKFTSSGEVVITVESPATDAAGEIAFSVSDSGIGIPKEKLASIFEAFEQVDASTARKYGGTGLGLPISKHLVECMGGTLRVDSEPGRGSTFYFTAKFGMAEPLGPQAQHERTRATGQAGSVEPARPAHILVADDSADNRFVIEAYLRGTPYSAVFAEDGRAAVKQFQQEQFDAILMDMQMPVMDGLSATRAIREIEKRDGRTALPIVALTANAQRESVEACRTAGCSAHLAKPVSKSALLGALQDALFSAGVSQPAETQPAAPLPSTPVPAAEFSSDDWTPPKVRIPEGLEAIAPRYLSARRKELPEMVALLAASDFEQISSRGHNMKGTGRSYGFPDLSEIGAALERSARQQDKESIDKQLLRLANYLESVQLSEQPAETR